MDDETKQLMNQAVKTGSMADMDVFVEAWFRENNLDSIYQDRQQSDESPAST